MTKIKLGDRVKAPCRLFRAHGPNWEKFWRKGATPVEGMYIGWRTYANGKIVTSTDDAWHGEITIQEWKGESWFKVGLLVKGERSAPVAVMFEDMELA